MQSGFERGRLRDGRKQRSNVVSVWLHGHGVDAGGGGGYGRVGHDSSVLEHGSTAPQSISYAVFWLGGERRRRVSRSVSDWVCLNDMKAKDKRRSLCPRGVQAYNGQ